MKRSLLLCVVFLSGISVQREAFASGGHLDRPSLSLPAGVQFDALKVLSDERHNYVTGHFINWNTVLHYAGDTGDLNRFLNNLVGVDGAKLLIQFSKDQCQPVSPFRDQKPPVQPCQWRVQHSGGKNDYRKLQITVYLGDDWIDIEKLELPPIAAEPKQGQ